MTATMSLMSKYLKLEAAANRISASVTASPADKKEAWDAANRVWEQIKKANTKKKKR